MNLGQQTLEKRKSEIMAIHQDKLLRLEIEQVQDQQRSKQPQNEEIQIMLCKVVQGMSKKDISQLIKNHLRLDNLHIRFPKFQNGCNQQLRFAILKANNYLELQIIVYAKQYWIDIGDQRMFYRVVPNQLQLDLSKDRVKISKIIEEIFRIVKDNNEMNIEEYLDNKIGQLNMYQLIASVDMFLVDTIVQEPDQKRLIMIMKLTIYIIERLSKFSKDFAVYDYRKQIFNQNEKLQIQRYIQNCIKTFDTLICCETLQISQITQQLVCIYMYILDSNDYMEEICLNKIGVLIALNIEKVLILIKKQEYKEVSDRIKLIKQVLKMIKIVSKRNLQNYLYVTEICGFQLCQAIERLIRLEDNLQNQQLQILRNMEIKEVIKLSYEAMIRLVDIKPKYIRDYLVIYDGDIFSKSYQVLDSNYIIVNKMLRLEQPQIIKACLKLIWKLVDQKFKDCRIMINRNEKIVDKLQEYCMGGLNLIYDMNIQRDEEKYEELQGYDIYQKILKYLKKILCQVMQLVIIGNVKVMSQQNYIKIIIRSNKFGLGGGSSVGYLIEGNQEVLQFRQYQNFVQQFGQDEFNYNYKEWQEGIEYEGMLEEIDSQRVQQSYVCLGFGYEQILYNLLNCLKHI